MVSKAGEYVRAKQMLQVGLHRETTAYMELISILADIMPSSENGS